MNILLLEYTRAAIYNSSDHSESVITNRSISYLLIVWRKRRVEVEVEVKEVEVSCAGERSPIIPPRNFLLNFLSREKFHLILVFF